MVNEEGANEVAPLSRRIQEVAESMNDDDATPETPVQASDRTIRGNMRSAASAKRAENFGNEQPLSSSIPDDLNSNRADASGDSGSEDLSTRIIKSPKTRPADQEEAKAGVIITDPKTEVAKAMDEMYQARFNQQQLVDIEAEKTVIEDC